ncbi:MAG: protein kinase [Gammaproteobacteria bacterium]|nr:protein kinase [Gammaproteobacteria bacterium]
MSTRTEALGKYELLNPLGLGRMGSVYLARDPFIDREVAVKVAHMEKLATDGDGSGYRRRFFQQAQTAGMLKHPNITAIYDAGVDGETCFIVMEYVNNGRTVVEHTRPSNLLPYDEVARVGMQCALALDYAHSKGLAHGDIKPGNILLSPSNVPKISDFGLHSDLTGEDRSSGADSRQESRYCAPEVLAGGPATPQGDVFSLGVVLYEMLTGHVPFRDGSPIATPLIDLRTDVPDIFQRIIDQALARPLHRRYQTAADLGSELALIADCSELKESATIRQGHFRALGESAFFSSFSDSDIWEILNSAEWLELPPGSLVIQEGDSESAFYIILSGTVEVSRGDVTLTTLGADDCFGEMGVAGGGIRSATITTQTPVQLLRVRTTTLERASTDLQLRFYKIFNSALVARLNHASSQLMNFLPVGSMG